MCHAIQYPVQNGHNLGTGPAGRRTEGATHCRSPVPRAWRPPVQSPGTSRSRHLPAASAKMDDRREGDRIRQNRVEGDRYVGRYIQLNWIGLDFDKDKDTLD